MNLKRTHSNGIECSIAENPPQCIISIKFRSHHDRASGGILAVHELTVERAKEFADDTVRNSGHLCTSACSEWAFLEGPRSVYF